MRGPNYWSVNRHKLIVMVLDIEDMEQRPTNTIDGFLERLKAMFPSMQEHRCSVGTPGGFFERVEEGTLSHVVKESGGSDSKIVVIPTASSIPKKVGENYMNAFYKLGCTDITLLD